MNFKKISMLVNEDNAEVKYQSGLCEVSKEYFNNKNSAKDGTHGLVLANTQQ